MASRESPIRRASDKAAGFYAEFRADIHKARVDLGLSQKRVATAAGTSRSALDRIEQGKTARLDLFVASKLAAAVGLDLSARLYAGKGHLWDDAQIRLIRQLRIRLGERWTWRFEAPLDLPDDQRCWDAVAKHADTGLSIAVDAFTRLRDCQVLLRREALKRRDGGVGRLVLLMSDTKANRLAIRDASDMFEPAFPVQTRAALAALMVGRDPGSDALVVLPPAPPKREKEEEQGDAGDGGREGASS